jgi:multisubunit Na+/H+ antiporter MnhE subunit
MAKLAEVTVWWAVLLLVWLASLNAFSYAELGTAAGLALPCALVARAARIATGGRWRIRARWLLLVPSAILHDTVSLLRLGFSARDDSFDEIGIRGDEATATIALSATPGSVVVDADEDRLLVHRLPIDETRLTEAVRK